MFNAVKLSAKPTHHHKNEGGGGIMTVSMKNADSPLTKGKNRSTSNVQLKVGGRTLLVFLPGPNYPIVNSKNVKEEVVYYEPEENKYLNPCGSREDTWLQQNSWVDPYAKRSCTIGCVSIIGGHFTVHEG
jgi:hypothetical protein